MLVRSRVFTVLMFLYVMLQLMHCLGTGTGTENEGMVVRNSEVQALQMGGTCASGAH